MSVRLLVLAISSFLVSADGQQKENDTVVISWKQSYRRLAKQQPQSIPPDFLDVEFTCNGTHYHLRLTRNSEIVSAKAKHVLDFGGGHVEYGPMPQSCFYLGKVVGHELSGVGISICDGGFTGLVLIGRRAISIEPAESRGLADELQAPANGERHKVRIIDDDRFQDFVGDIAQYTKVPTGSISGGRALSGAAKKYVEVVVVNDNSRFASFGGQSGLNALATHSTNVMNAVTTIYNTAPQGGQSFPYQIQVVLTGMYTNIAADPWESTVNTVGSETDCSSLLDLFSSWGQNQQIAGVLPACDNRVLLSGRNFDGSTVGLAYVSTMCELSRTANVNMCTESDTAAKCAGIVAHEMGHNFGMRHDGSGINSACPTSDYVMEAVGDGTASTQFSSCSVSNIETFFNDAYVGNGNCLENTPTQVFGTPVCGNGFVEPGDNGSAEECDCGQADCSSLDPCCNGATCKFAQTTFQCSDATGPCCLNCMFIAASANSICRPARNSCDIQEICAGSTADCPRDEFYFPGKACIVVGGGTTYSGLCSAGKCMSLNYTCAVETSRDFSGSYDLTETCAAYNDACDKLICHDASASESYDCAQNFATHGKQMPVPEGTPCWFQADPRGTRFGMCSGGRCTQQDMLAVVPFCGNGGIDYGEGCDCGNDGDPCCDCATCTLKSTSQCSSLDACCDNSTCNFKPNGTTCRAAISTCDVAEFCTGSSAICPFDVGKQWGTACTSDDAVPSTCYGKTCLPSLDQQCASKNSNKPKAGMTTAGVRRLDSDHSCQALVCCASCALNSGSWIVNGVQVEDPWLCESCYISTASSTFTVNGVSNTIYLGGALDGTMLQDSSKLCSEAALTTPAASCSSTQYLEESVGKCMPCAVACTACNGPTIHDCVACAFGEKDNRGACPVSTDQVVFSGATPFSPGGSGSSGGLVSGCLDQKSFAIATYVFVLLCCRLHA